MEILVFKTNVSDKEEVMRLVPHMDSLDGIVRWNVDLQDKDNILRIVSASVGPRQVERRLQAAGYFCEELED